MRAQNLLFIIILFFVVNTNGQMIVINEFVAVNNTIVHDVDGDYSDWIELYNASNTTINLVNYSLSDDEDELDKWTFPTINILPNSYLLIFASDKNYLDTAELHTNFKISSSGEKLFLSNPLGEIVDETISVSLSDDESYCRVPDGSETWIVTSVTSPNSSNNLSNQLIFSNEQGFYTEQFSLSINSITGDTIFYTLNGDVPTIDSDVFDGSVLIENINSQPNGISEIPTSADPDLIDYHGWQSPQGIIDKATTLRCASFRDGQKTSKIYSKTYFVDDEMTEKYTVPVISLITQNENLFHPDTGIFVPGERFDTLNPQYTGNFFIRGFGWERDVHIELFDKNGNLGFAQDAGLRIHGGKSRQAAQKSLRLYAREEYGKDYFDYNLLPRRSVDEYKRFILRATMGSWHDQSIIKDVLAHNIASSLNIDYQEFQPAIVYVNGEYWGIHTIRDRIDERYIEYLYDIDHDSVVFLQPGDVYYDDLMEFIEFNSLENNSNYEYVKTQIDIDSYIDYTIAELFFENYDWPENNVKIWRAIPNGKWRWVFYDIDAGLVNENYNMLIHATNSDTTNNWINVQSTLLFRKLLENSVFKDRFVNRYAEILNADFESELMLHKLDSIKEIYSPEIQNHIVRWNFPNSYDSWENDVDNKLLSFLENRPCKVRDNIMSFFGLTDFDFNCDTYIVDNFESDQFLIAPNPNRGEFFVLNNHSDIRDATITIMNINGQVIYKEMNVDLKKNQKKYFNLSNLSQNVYVLQVTSNQFFVQEKIVVTEY